MADHASDAPSLRRDLALELCGRRDTLADALAPLLAAQSTATLAWDAAERLAGHIVAAFTASVSEDEPPRDALQPVIRLCGMLPARSLVMAVYLCERLVHDELAIVDRFGTLSGRWTVVSQIVRRSGFALVAELTDTLGAPDGDLAADGATDGPVGARMFERLLSQELHRSQRHDHRVSLVVLDAQNHGQLHAEHGPGVAARIVDYIGLTLRGFFRPYDWVGHYTPSAVAVLLPETTLETAVDLASRARALVEQRLSVADYRTGERLHVPIAAGALGLKTVRRGVEPAHVLSRMEDLLRLMRTSDHTRIARMDL